MIERENDIGHSQRVVSSMLQVMASRGPDGHESTRERRGEWNVVLGHRRLAIIDLQTGVQPMANVEATHAITFNGEIYNFRELRRELEGAGRSFATRSDTEVILQLHAERGDDAVASLNGMFAYALWEPGRRRLLLARDRAGIKPLFYAPLPDGGIAFGSTLSVVLQHPRVDHAPDVAGYASYFFSDYLHPPHSIVRDVRQLPPGHVLVWEDGRLGHARRFWSIPSVDARHFAGRTERDLAAETWDRLGACVERQLVADVPVGIFLSGGLDSSSVAVLAAERSKERMLAFSIGFEDATYDESAHARTVARAIGVRHVEEILRERDVLGVVDEALDMLDQPLGDPSYLPTFILSRLAARHVKVVVGGDGGDELWGGYPTYLAHKLARIYRVLPRPLRERWIMRCIDLLPLNEGYQSLEWKLRRFVGRWDDRPLVRHQRWMSALDLPALRDAIPASASMLPATLHDAELPPGEDPINRLLALDFSTYMSGSVLTKVDRASMAHGLEVRPPLLDNDMIDWAFSLPSHYKLRGKVGKYLFKKAASGHVPRDIIARPKKGFGIPLRAWLRGPLAEKLDAVMSGSPVWDGGLLERETFREYHLQHRAKQVDHSKPLWSLLVLDHWLRRLRDTAQRAPRSANLDRHIV
ncbi:asparagine synthase (glutamine-hydrolyzing) [Pendulispora albinea]|uniref:asparagine synthase (glutamine-hydrolyzing) n=1 Tax=Pendulispora albinea TaxID=2741071 RepID=A0ABZ2LM86_9BACT